MKFISVIIWLLFLADNTVAQQLQPLHSFAVNKNIFLPDVRIEIYAAEKHPKQKHKTTFYFFTDDTLQTNKINIALNEFITNNTACAVIKILFKKTADTLYADSLQRFAEDFSRRIMPEILKKYPEMKADRIIVSGENGGAAVALFASMLFPEKFRNTAIFTDDFSPVYLLKSSFKNLLTTAVKVKGKLFMYVLQKDKNETAPDVFADMIGLHAAGLVYKIDALDDRKINAAFTDMYNWLSAEGSNYVINIQ